MSFPLESLSSGKIIEQILPIFNDACKDETPPIEPKFAQDLLILLIRYDSINGFVKEAYNPEMVPTISVCKLEQFLEETFRRCTNGTDATIAHLKLLNFFRHADLKHLENVKEKFYEEYEEQADTLLKYVLQYPENSTRIQYEEMMVKVQTLIISRHHLGCPKNHVLQKQTRQSLKCIIGERDLFYFVHKKRYNRLEYMQRIASITAGMVIHSNYPPEGEKEHFTNILFEISKTSSKIKGAIQKNIAYADELLEKGADLYRSSFTVDSVTKSIQYYIPLRKMSTINSYLCLFLCYKRCMEILMQIVSKTEILIASEEKKFHCVMAKIKYILQYREAISSEKIFPHFYFLSQLWTTFVCLHRHLNEIITIEEKINELVNQDILDEFHRICDEFNVIVKATNPPPVSHSVKFEKIFSNIFQVPSRQQNLIMPKVFTTKYLEQYCSWSLMLTGGLLVPADNVKKFLNKYKYAFGQIQSIKLAQMDIKTFMNQLFSVILTNLDLILLFEVDEVLLMDEIMQIKDKSDKTRAIDTQTDHRVYENKIPPSQWIEHTWNAWDYYRETILLANMRRKQSHSGQTNLSFGKRNAQNQMYDTRSHMQ